jgi:hypothetical protein
VNGYDVGDEFELARGELVTVTAEAWSRFPLGVLQIVSNGQILGTTQTEDNHAELSLSCKVEEPRWFVARCGSPEIGTFAPLNAPNLAHTSVIHVLVDGKRVFRPEAAAFWRDRMKEHSVDIARRAFFTDPTQRQEAVGYVDEGVSLYEEMLTRGI